jgi:T5SS/PEP-CTERM-associated repeat protein
MKHLKSFLCIMLAVAAVGLMAVSGAQAAITYGGDASGSTIGNIANGTLSVDSGSSLTSGLTAYIGYNTGVTGAVDIDGTGSTWSNASLYVGYRGAGTLNVKNGAVVYTGPSAVYLGRYAGSNGTITVDGAGSKLVNTAYLYVGRAGNGKLVITNGGSVINEATSANSSIGLSSGGTGTVIVNGTGSNWTSSSYITLGSSGSGKLSITDGGAVRTTQLNIAGNSILTVDVGRGSSLNVYQIDWDYSSGKFYSTGTTRLVAGSGAANSTYTPITATNWAKSGTVQALGGIWNDTDHTMTVSDAALAFAGRATGIDLASAQRVLFVDPATAQVAGMSFLGATTSTPITVTASVMSAAALSALRGVLPSGETILSGWNFTTEGYASGSPVYLSLYAGPDYSFSTLSIWHYDGSTWSAFTANDLAYDGTYASFTVTGFSGYAVSGAAPVPVPAAVWLLGSGLAGLVGMRRRLFRK